MNRELQSRRIAAAAVLAGFGRVPAGTWAAWAARLADHLRFLLDAPGEAAQAAAAESGPPGPFETAADVRALPAVRAAYAAAHVSSRRGVLGERSHRLLCQALETAGVELGGYDHRILTWLGQWEPETAAVICGWAAGPPGRAARGGHPDRRAGLCGR